MAKRILNFVFIVLFAPKMVSCRSANSHGFTLDHATRGHERTGDSYRSSKGAYGLSESPLKTRRYIHSHVAVPHMSIPDLKLLGRQKKPPSERLQAKANVKNVRRKKFQKHRDSIRENTVRQIAENARKHYLNNRPEVTVKFTFPKSTGVKSKVYQSRLKSGKFKHSPKAVYEDGLHAADTLLRDAIPSYNSIIPLKREYRKKRQHVNIYDLYDIFRRNLFMDTSPHRHYHHKNHVKIRSVETKNVLAKIIAMSNGKGDYIRKQKRMRSVLDFIVNPHSFVSSRNTKSTDLQGKSETVLSTYSKGNAKQKQLMKYEPAIPISSTETSPSVVRANGKSVHQQPIDTETTVKKDSKTASAEVTKTTPDTEIVSKQEARFASGYMLQDTAAKDRVLHSPFAPAVSSQPVVSEAGNVKQTVTHAELVSPLLSYLTSEQLPVQTDQPEENNGRSPTAVLYHRGLQQAANTKVETKRTESSHTELLGHSPETRVHTGQTQDVVKTTLQESSSSVQTSSPMQGKGHDPSLPPPLPLLRIESKQPTDVSPHTSVVTDPAALKEKSVTNVGEYPAYDLTSTESVNQHSAALKQQPTSSRISEISLNLGPNSQKTLEGSKPNESSFHSETALTTKELGSQFSVNDQQTTVPTVKKENRPTKVVVVQDTTDLPQIKESVEQIGYNPKEPTINTNTNGSVKRPSTDTITENRAPTPKAHDSNGPTKVVAVQDTMDLPQIKESVEQIGYNPKEPTINTNTNGSVKRPSTDTITENRVPTSKAHDSNGPTKVVAVQDTMDLPQIKESVEQIGYNPKEPTINTNTNGSVKRPSTDTITENRAPTPKAHDSNGPTKVVAVPDTMDLPQIKESVEQIGYNPKEPTINTNTNGSVKRPSTDTITENRAPTPKALESNGPTLQKIVTESQRKKSVAQRNPILKESVRQEPQNIRASKEPNLEMSSYMRIIDKLQNTEVNTHELQHGESNSKNTPLRQPGEETSLHDLSQSQAQNVSKKSQRSKLQSTILKLQEIAKKLITSQMRQRTRQSTNSSNIQLRGTRKTVIPGQGNRTPAAPINERRTGGGDMLSNPNIQPRYTDRQNNQENGRLNLQIQPGQWEIRPARNYQQLAQQNPTWWRTRANSQLQTSNYQIDREPAGANQNSEFSRTRVRSPVKQHPYRYLHRPHSSTGGKRR